MDSNKIANWLQVAGNLGLLAGLVLVGFQISEKHKAGQSRSAFHCHFRCHSIQRSDARRESRNCFREGSQRS